MAEMRALFFSLLLLIVARPSSSLSSSRADIISLTAETPESWDAWANVSVSWQGVPVQPAVDATSDWVGAFLVSFNATYILYTNVTTPTTAGRVEFRLLNGRHPYIFRYFRGDDVLATSNIISPPPNVPNQGHLSFRPSAAHTNEMVLTWTSGDPTPGLVRFGVSASSLNATAAASVDTYTAADFTDCMRIPAIPPRTTPFANLSSRAIRCGFQCYNDPTASELFLDPGHLHTAVMGGLVPGERYYYDYGSAGTDDDARGGQRSPVYSFVAPRAGSDPDAQFSFLLTADMGIGGVKPGESGSATDNDPNHMHPGYPRGIGNGADAVVREGLLGDPLTEDDEFVILNGDISYARGWPWIWERFFDLVLPLTTTMPMMVTVGNHEVDSHENPFEQTAGGDSGGECGVPSAKRFPAQLSSPQKMHYSFTHGSVHVVMLSTEHPVDDQVEFFKQDVAQLDRSAVPWLVVAMHRPIFTGTSPGTSASDLDKILRTSWHPLFVSSGVDFVFTGHVHYYERLCPVDMPQPNNVSALSCAANRDRPVYIVDGSAGAEPTMPSGESEASDRDERNGGLTEFIEYARWGYSRVFVSSKTIELRHYSAKIAPDGMSVELPFVMTDSIKLERKGLGLGDSDVSLRSELGRGRMDELSLAPDLIDNRE